MIGILGLVVLYGIGYLLSRHRRAVSPRTILWGLGLQLLFALAVMRTTPGQRLFAALASGVTMLLDFAGAGAEFVLGPLAGGDFAGFILAFQVLPVVIFIASFFSVLYHLGILPRLVLLMARGMRRTMGISGAESLGAAANVFMGQTEAPIIVAPYIPSMTRSELMALMTGGFATVSGAVLAAYIGLGVRAEYLLAASVMAAPASLVMAKLLLPETERPKTAGKVTLEARSEAVNLLDAAARGATQGMKLALNIAAMLIAFLALVALANGILGLVGEAFGDAPALRNLSAMVAVALVAWILLWRPDRRLAARGALATLGALAIAWILFAVRGPQPLQLSIEGLLGALFAPVAWLMGVPWSEARLVGELFGVKLVLTELIAYTRMVEMVGAGMLSPKSELIASYALCGFANFASVAVQLGGIGGLAPTRAPDLARIGLWAMFAGMMTSYTVATLAGLLSGL